ncbi:ribosomal protein S18-alanine N-acetyltransferase [Dellaglioa sp. P0083]|uniref:ribosomal protein S18-alanine N-acetyltransferase n=1 Tax=Dellaglioa kimchii TaxID=3344667 RepID=UPI0038D3D985
MLKKFKARVKQIIPELRPDEPVRTLVFQNHRIQIRNESYFMTRAVVPDIPELLEIEKAVYGGKSPWSAKIFEGEICQKSKTLYLVLRKEDKMLGFIGCSTDAITGDVHIANIAVLPECQGRGMGNFLVTSITRRARLMKFRTVSLEVRRDNQTALNLYHQLGFTKVGIRENYYIEDGQDAVDMLLKLK